MLCFLKLTFLRVKVDLQGSKLLGDMEECKNGLFNLVLSGVATPYFHNGTNLYDANGETLVLEILK